MDERIKFIRRIIPETSTQFTVGPWYFNGSAVDLNFQTGLYWDGEAESVNPTLFVSIYRASIGYAKTAAGTLTLFGTDTLRITDLGLLIENGQTNLCLYSQTLPSDWGLTNVTITTDNANAPDGTLTADAVIPSVGNTIHDISRSVTMSAGQNYTWSVYANAAGYNYVSVGGFAGADYMGKFLLSGAGSFVQDRSGNLDSYGIEQLANGWYRIWVTKNSIIGDPGSNIQVGVWPDGSSTDWNAMGSGDGTSGAYFWGMQVENDTFPSSYIPTTTTTAARAWDAVGIIGAFASPFLSLPNSVLANVQTPPIPAFGFWGIVGAEGAGQLLMIQSDNTGVACDGPSLVLSPMGGGTGFKTGVKIALAQDGSGRSVFGGGSVASDANPGHAFSMGLCSNSGYVTYVTFRRITVWQSKLPDSTLQALTAP